MAKGQGPLKDQRVGRIKSSRRNRTHVSHTGKESKNWTPVLGQTVSHKRPINHLFGTEWASPHTCNLLPSNHSTKTCWNMCQLHHSSQSKKWPAFPASILCHSFCAATCATNFDFNPHKSAITGTRYKLMSSQYSFKDSNHQCSMHGQDFVGFTFNIHKVPDQGFFKRGALCAGALSSLLSDFRCCLRPQRIEKHTELPNSS